MGGKETSQPPTTHRQPRASGTISPLRADFAILTSGVRSIGLLLGQVDRTPLRQGGRCEASGFRS